MARLKGAARDLACEHAKSIRFPCITALYLSVVVAFRLPRLISLLRVPPTCSYSVESGPSKPLTTLRKRVTTSLPAEALPSRLLRKPVNSCSFCATALLEASRLARNVCTSAKATGFSHVLPSLIS